MRDVFAAVARWLDEKRRFALATLVLLRESAPAPIGTTVAVDDAGEIFGNIGAGCYENEIVEAALRTASDGEPRGLDIDLTAEEPFPTELGCGAKMEIVTWRPSLAFRDDAAAIAQGDRDVRVVIEYRRGDGGAARFEHVYRAKHTIFVIGATTLAAELVTIAARLDFKTIVVDPRPAFATKRRLPNADAIVRAWPDDYLPAVLTGQTPIIVLSHDRKFDLPALRCALRSAAPYIGLLGSRRLQAARRDALRALGFDDSALARVHGPAGLDIGGSTPAETALSILAEIVASRHDRGGAPLRSTSWAIHRHYETVPVNA